MRNACAQFVKSNCFPTKRRSEHGRSMRERLKPRPGTGISVEDGLILPEYQAMPETNFAPGEQGQSVSLRPVRRSALVNMPAGSLNGVKARGVRVISSAGSAGRRLVGRHHDPTIKRSLSKKTLHPDHAKCMLIQPDCIL